MAQNLQLVENLLRAASPEGLLRTFAALTHQMHASTGDDSAALRVQRDIVEAELLRRLGSTPDGEQQPGEVCGIVVQPDGSGRGLPCTAGAGVHLAGAHPEEAPVLPPRAIRDAPQA